MKDAAIVSSVGVGVAYTGLDYAVASGVTMLTKGAVPTGVLRPIVFGLSVGLTVFIIDLVYMYKYTYY